MFNNILNLEGVSVLDKKQQGIINGGIVDETHFCIFTMTLADGSTDKSYQFTDLAGSAQSTAANATCVDAVINVSVVSGCSYDCSWDGINW